MSAAIETARSTLPTFWEKLAAPGADESGFALKAGFPSGWIGSEHVWLIEIERSGATITGVLNNVPKELKLKEGQRVDITPSRISDWMFMRGGKIVGNYTLRPLLKRMPPHEAAQYRELLENP